MQSTALSTARQALGKALGRSYTSPEEAAYRRLAAKGYAPAAIVDVGAYQGEWTRLVRRVFVDVPVLMVEAQAGKMPFLDRVCVDLPGVACVSTVLGETAGEEVVFYEMETGSSLMSERSDVPRVATRLVSRTLDDVASAIIGPLFLKIDVQGAELEVLGGGTQTLARADLVQLEVAMLPYNEGAPTILDVLNYMDGRDFVPLDVSGFSRPNGVDLAQMDLLFVKRSSALRPTHFSFLP